MKKKLLSIVLSLTLVMSLGACGGKQNENSDHTEVDGSSENVSDDTKEPIRFAFVGPLTGDVSEFGIGMQTAYQIAIDEQNEKGGLLGHPLELVSFDDKNSPEEAASCAEKIVGDESIVAVMGHYASGVAMTAAPIYQESDMVLVSNSSSHPDYSALGDCIFRNNAVTANIVGYQVQAVAEVCNAKVVGNFEQNNDSGVSNSEVFVSKVEEYGEKAPFEIAHIELANDGSVDYSAIIAKFMDAGCDTIFSSCSYSVAGPFLKQYREKDPDIKFMGTDGSYSSECLELLNGDTGDVYNCVNFTTEQDREVVNNFCEKFEAEFGAPPQTLFAQTYDSARMLFAAIEAGNSVARRDIVDNLYQVEIESVVGEKLSFDENGDAFKKPMVLDAASGSYSTMSGALIDQEEWEASVMDR